MKKKEKIEQHLLVNRLGEKVDFLMEDWGESLPFSYDFLKAHRHHFYEVMVFEKGDAQHDIDFNTFKAGAGSIHFVAPDNVHLLMRGKTSKGFSLQFTDGYLTGDLVDPLPFNTESPVLQLSKKDRSSILRLADQMRNELSEKRAYSDKLIHSYFQSFMLLLLRNTQQQAPGNAFGKISQHVSSFRELTRKHYLKHYTVEEYASLLNISSKHLIDICKEHTGKTPLKLIQEVLVSEAKKQLFHTGLPVKEIAYSLGFDDPANFSNYFKAATGYSPAAYRQEAGK